MGPARDHRQHVARRPAPDRPGRAVGVHHLGADIGAAHEDPPVYRDTHQAEDRAAGLDQRNVAGKVTVPADEFLRPVEGVDQPEQFVFSRDIERRGILLANDGDLWREPREPSGQDPVGLEVGRGQRRLVGPQLTFVVSTLIYLHDSADRVTGQGDDLADQRGVTVDRQGAGHGFLSR